MYLYLHMDTQCEAQTGSKLQTELLNTIEVFTIRSETLLLKEWYITPQTFCSKQQNVHIIKVTDIT